MTTSSRSDDLRAPALAALLAAGLLFPLCQSFVVPVEPALRAAAGDVAAAWSTTVVLLVAAVVAPLGGRLGDRFGRRRVLLGVLGLVTVGAVVALLGVSGAGTGAFLAGRGLQGVAVAVFPLAFGLLRELSPAARVAPRVAAMTGAIGLGNGVGVGVAGPVTAAAGPAGVFVLQVVASVAALVLAAGAVPADRVRGSRTPAGLGDVLRLRTPVLVYACATLTGIGMFGAFMLVPLLAQLPVDAGAGLTGAGLGADPSVAGLYLLPHAVVMAAAGPLTGWLHPHLGARGTLLAGCVLALAATALVVVATTSAPAVLASNAVLGLGVGLAFAAMDTLVVTAVPAAVTGLASGLTLVARSAGAAAGSQLAVVAIAAGGGGPAGHWWALVVTGAGFAVAITAAAALPRARESRGFLSGSRMECPGWGNELV